MATGELVSHILSGDLEAVKTLFEEKGDLVNVNDDDVEYTEDGVEKTLTKPLIVAAIQDGKNEDIVKLLLEKGADVNKFYKGLDPPGPIFFVTEYSNPKISEELSFHILEHADATLKNSRGQTILFEAQLRNPEYAAKLLQKFGINIAERDQQGHTVVDEVLFHDMYALMPVYQKYVLGLIKANDVNSLENLVLDGFEYVMQGGGVSAIDIALQSEAQDVVQFIEKVPQIMDTIPTLHSAVGAGNLDGVNSIITEQLARAKDSAGRCTLHLAVMCEQQEIVDYLLENYSQTVKISDNLKRTALHYAAALVNGDQLYDKLVKAGADETAKDVNNLTPKDYLLEMESPGSTKTDYDVQGLIEKEKSAKYGVKIYLKLQYQSLSKAIEANDTGAAQSVIDNLAFDLDDFVNEDVTNVPPLFLCVQHGAEDIALYMLHKGADPKVKYEGTNLHEAAFKANLGILYQTLAEIVGFKARRLSAFSDTSSMQSEAVIMPRKPPPVEHRAPADLKDFDSQYLGTVLGDALTKALTDLCERRPWDPIEYLAQWLYKHSENEAAKAKKAEEEYLIDVQRAEAEKEAIRARRRQKESKHLQKLDAARQKEMAEQNRLREEEEKKKKELEELRTRQREMDQFAQPPDLDTVKEVEEPAIQVAVVDDTEDAAQEQTNGEE